ncbi:hypothetical protein KUTG_00013 [Kutzneria sp. 744]|nr:hypothetical protein KUTG_00013 [Kutzneria sp. 744]
MVLDLGYATLPRLLTHWPDGVVDAVVFTHEHPDHCIDLHGRTCAAQPNVHGRWSARRSVALDRHEEILDVRIPAAGTPPRPLDRGAVQIQIGTRPGSPREQHSGPVTCPRGQPPGERVSALATREDLVSGDGDNVESVKQGGNHVAGSFLCGVRDQRHPVRHHAAFDGGGQAEVGQTGHSRPRGSLRGSGEQRQQSDVVPWTATVLPCRSPASRSSPARPAPPAAPGADRRRCPAQVVGDA